MISQLEITNLTPGFAAEIHGLHPDAVLDEEARRWLRSAFDDRGVLLFRGLEIDRAYQLFLSELLVGEEDLSSETIAADAEKQGRFYISNKRDGAAAPFGRLMFHTDMMWSDNPFTVLSLYGEEVEPPVAPTLFASPAHAWDTLPDDLRARVDGLSAVHVTGPEGFDGRRRGDVDGELVQPLRDRVLSATTSVAHRHPRTDRPLLYVSQGMTKEIAGLPHDESEDLLEALFAHLYAPENLWQHEWRQGDLLVWDNLAVQHARPDVRTDGPVRTLRKIGWPSPSPQDTQVLVYQKLD
jgi:alpha-ketoglutarate-dependent taurine dioxygenase